MFTLKHVSLGDQAVRNVGSHSPSHALTEHDPRLDDPRLGAIFAGAGPRPDQNRRCLHSRHVSSGQTI